MTAPLLHVDNLHTYFYSSGKQAFIRSVDGVAFDIAEGETLGLVGESGSGKSITALSIMGLISEGPGVIRGNIHFKTNGTIQNLLEHLDTYVTVSGQNNRIMQVNKDLVGWEKNVDKIMRDIRGKKIGMIFQNPKSSLNPFQPVGKQIMESILLHTSVTNPEEARERALTWLDRVKIDSPRLRFDNYPYGLSGGMCQRAMIAMALAGEPLLLIADEPTTGLDATIQSKIIDLLAELKSEFGITILLISHDISIISRLSERVAVMYGGTIVEYGPSRDVLARDRSAKHPYTQALLASIPNEENLTENGYLKAIEGDVLDTINIPEGCRFQNRCSRCTDAIREQCMHEEPPLHEIAKGHHIRCWLFES
ncbi:MAG: ABC transporter ATP-binding protein [Nitrospirota bacterium]